MDRGKHDEVMDEGVKRSRHDETHPIKACSINVILGYAIQYLVHDVGGVCDVMIPDDCMAGRQARLFILIKHVTETLLFPGLDQGFL